MSIENKIEAMVYAGMIMDDHGKWIPIAEKLQKEQRFLSHLERGQILTNGKWISLSEKPAAPASTKLASSPVEIKSDVHEETTLDPPPASPEETVFLTTEEIKHPSASERPPSDASLTETIDSTTEAPDETVSFPAAHLRSLASDLPSDDNSGDPTNYPPETKSMFITPVPPPETTVSFDAEFEETVLFNSKSFHNPPPTANNSADSPTRNNNAQTDPAPSFLEPLPHSRTGIPRSILILSATTLLLLIVLMKMYC